jgi:hypothetical protein
MFDADSISTSLIRPAVAALGLSRSKLATRASLGFVAAVLAGRVLMAAVKWALAWVLSPFQ